MLIVGIVVLVVVTAVVGVRVVVVVGRRCVSLSCCARNGGRRLGMKCHWYWIMPGVTNIFLPRHATPSHF